jgi:hypothetical protein
MFKSFMQFFLEEFGPFLAIFMLVLVVSLGFMLIERVEDCGKSNHSAGYEQNACYPNNTCNDGLVCRSQICVH